MIISKTKWSAIFNLKPFNCDHFVCWTPSKKLQDLTSCTRTISKWWSVKLPSPRVQLLEMSLTPGDKFNSLLWMNREMNIPMNSLTVFLQVLNIYTGRVKKSVICCAWFKIVSFLCNSPEWCFFIFFLKICIFFWYSNGSKKILRPNFHFHTDKNSFSSREHKMKESQLTQSLKVVPLDIKIKFWRLARCHI